MTDMQLTITNVDRTYTEHIQNLYKTYTERIQSLTQPTHSRTQHYTANTEYRSVQSLTLSFLTALHSEYRITQRIQISTQSDTVLTALHSEYRSVHCLTQPTNTPKTFRRPSKITY